MVLNLRHFRDTAIPANVEFAYRYEPKVPKR
jgi:hypothetical protein